MYVSTYCRPWIGGAWRTLTGATIIPYRVVVAVLNVGEGLYVEKSREGKVSKGSLLSRSAAVFFTGDHLSEVSLAGLLYVLAWSSEGSLRRLPRTLAVEGVQLQLLNVKTLANPLIRWPPYTRVGLESLSANCSCGV